MSARLDDLTFALMQHIRREIEAAPAELRANAEQLAALECADVRERGWGGVRSSGCPTKRAGTGRVGTAVAVSLSPVKGYAVKGQGKPMFSTLTEKQADALYDLLKEHLGADEAGRAAFAWHYCCAPEPGESACHDLRCGGKYGAAFSWTRRGLGTVIWARSAERQAQANAAIQRLEQWLLSIPPVTRLDWIRGPLATGAVMEASGV